MSGKEKLFIVGCVVFLVLSSFVSYWLLVGCGVGVFGSWFVFPKIKGFRVVDKRKIYERKRQELLKLRDDLGIGKEE